MGDVFIIYGNQIDTMVRRLIEESGALKQLRPDDTVVIKPQEKCIQWGANGDEPQLSYQKNNAVLARF